MDIRSIMGYKGDGCFEHLSIERMNLHPAIPIP